MLMPSEWREADQCHDLQLVDCDLDIEEAICIAVASNDVPGLVGDVLMRLRPCSV